MAKLSPLSKEKLHSSDFNKCALLSIFDRKVTENFVTKLLQNTEKQCNMGWGKGGGGWWRGCAFHFLKIFKSLGIHILLMSSKWLGIFWLNFDTLIKGSIKTCLYPIFETSANALLQNIRILVNIYYLHVSWHDISCKLILRIFTDKWSL